MEDMIKIDKKVLKKIIKLILIIIWMIIVFMFSNQGGESSGNSSMRVTEIIVKIFHINANENVKNIINQVIRKIAHYVIYTIGGILILNYMYKDDKEKYKDALKSITLGGIYAITDEIHQAFISDRNASGLDVLLDTFGVATGVMLYLGIRKIFELIYQKRYLGGKRK